MHGQTAFHIKLINSLYQTFYCNFFSSQESVSASVRKLQDPLGSKPNFHSESKLLLRLSTICLPCLLVIQSVIHTFLCLSVCNKIKISSVAPGSIWTPQMRGHYCALFLCSTTLSMFLHAKLPFTYVFFFSATQLLLSFCFCSCLYCF